MDYNDSKKRFKLYKAGKAWLIAGTVFLTLIGANLAANADSTTTDTGNNSVQNTQTVPNNQDITSADADQNNVTPISSKADDKNQTETTKGTDETVNELINGDSNAVESNSTTTIDDISSKSDKDKDDVTTTAQADSNNQNSTSLNTDNINKDKNVSTETTTNNHDDSVKSDSSTPTDNAKPDGWNADHTQYTQDGQLVTGVQNIDGTYYDFDENHNLVKNNYVQSQWGDWYMFGDNGQVVSGVTPWAGTYYDFDPVTYLRIDNAYVPSQWGTWYLFGNDGRIVSGVTQWAGTYYDFDPYTYLRVDNNYVQSQWGEWYMFGNDGRIVIGVTPWAGTYYYFDPHTYLKVENNYVQSQWGTWYLFGSDGRIDAGVSPWAGTYYYFDPYTFTRVDNQWRSGYWFDNDGKIVTSSANLSYLNVKFAYERKQQAINTMINWMTDKIGKVSYSMTYRNGPYSYDCSSAVYHALAAGGFLPVGSNGTTETEFGDLERHGWVIVPASQARRGDVFIWGDRGHTLGGDGHTGIFYDDYNDIIHCNYAHNGITINNANNVWEDDDEPIVTVYRFNGIL